MADLPIVILTHDGTTAEGHLREVSRHPDAGAARKAVRDLPVGHYHIARYLNEGVRVSPPPRVETNQVDWGTTYITRGSGEPDATGSES